MRVGDQRMMRVDDVDPAITMASGEGPAALPLLLVAAKKLVANVLGAPLEPQKLDSSWRRSRVIS
jgi:hypothetical protein